MDVNRQNAWGLHWFRRDLRLTGNVALIKNLEKHEGRTLGVFFFDSVFLARRDFSHHRFSFFLDSILSLRERMRSLGGDLLVIDRVPQQGFVDLFELLNTTAYKKPSYISFNRDYEPFARARDREMLDIINKKLQVPVETERDHLLIEPNELLKPDGTPYRIYTPFFRRWFEIFKSKKIQDRLNESLREPREFTLNWRNVLGAKAKELDALSRFCELNSAHVKIRIPRAGEDAANKCLESFKNRIGAYSENRDLPALTGTSQISIFLKNGSLSSSQAISKLKLDHLTLAGKKSEVTYLKELVWREFYYHILWHFPHVENGAFIDKYNRINWENNEDFFAAWKTGKTGYPIVDAGMRQLNNTGWMHNRVRMIVASFLVKDLRVDWRWGEKYFMEQLLDGDLAPNNGGWQWSASTGCDPQPYFRIFNPTLQSEKFDPQGVYIKKWCPERSKMNSKEIHKPVVPVVDHASRKLGTLKMYQVD